MKAVFIALGVYAGVGGLERFNQRVVRSLAELGRSEGLESWALALWDSPGQGAGAPGPVRFFAGESNKLRTAAAFLGRVSRTRPDVILYGHVLLSPLVAAARALSPQSRHVLFVHGREVWLEPFRSRVPVRERLAVRHGMDEVAAVSRLTSRRMSRAYGLPESRFWILPNAVDPPECPPSPPNGAGGQLRLLTVSRLGRGDRYKGCDKVIRALPRVLAEVPNARYQLVGEGALRPELERLAEEVGVRRAVHFLGYVDDARLEQAYQDSHLMVMPSTGEGFGIVFLEAWKHGLPVIAGDQDASAEVVTHGVNGLCVNPASVEEIAGAVVTLLKDPERAGRMGQRGYETVLEQYTHDHFRSRLWQILRGGSHGAV
jgi:glycosyltransferase involved in cell wall biosynthesis